jgi:DNA-binding transcriptional regulator LsrR (DeoR family)
MARIDEWRLMAKVAHMYYTQGLRQTDICQRLNVHQSTVSRLLKRAEREGIVRTTVSLHPYRNRGRAAVQVRAARSRRGGLRRG